jgi:phosphohistidine swiveling domain-containing protein
VGIVIGSGEVPGRKAVASDDDDDNNNNNNLIILVILFLIQMFLFPFCCYITNIIILEPG